eukprot:scaffold8886_cov125-Isochrysis_galbana.AAC.7
MMTDPPTDDTEAREPDSPDPTDAKHHAPLHGHTGAVPPDKALSDSSTSRCKIALLFREEHAPDRRRADRWARLRQKQKPSSPMTQPTAMGDSNICLHTTYLQLGRQHLHLHTKAATTMLTRHNRSTDYTTRQEEEG